jgi:hypothetical protein
MMSKNAGKSLAILITMTMQMQMQWYNVGHIV